MGGPHEPDRIRWHAPASSLDCHAAGAEWPRIVQSPARRPGADPVAHRQGLRGHWALTQLAAAAILLLTVVGIYRIYSEGGSSGNGHNGAVIPAAEQCGTPGSQSGVPTGSPVALDVMVASPDDAAADPVSFIWQTEGAPELPEFVTHMAIDPACRLWVMDVQGDRFLIFDLDGNLLETWGTSGSGDGQFDFANAGSYMYNGIAFAPDGGFYVSDAANGRVQHFDADRQFVRSWAINDSDGMISATSSWIAVGPDGNVYVVVNTDRGMIQVYSPDGELIRAFGSLADGPDHLSSNGPIAFDPAGHLWVMDRLDGSLVQFSPAGEIQTKIEPQELGTFDISPVGTEPIGLAIDDAGRFFVTDIASNNVFVYDPERDLPLQLGRLGRAQGRVLQPCSRVVVDGNGGVYVTDGGVPRIQKFQVQP